MQDPRSGDVLTRPAPVAPPVSRASSDPVRAFEEAFAGYVGARHGIALCNGTATLHTALKALGVGPGHKVAVPPLTMASTTIAVLHAGAEPVFVDVDPGTWLMDGYDPDALSATIFAVPVSLYGLHAEPTFSRTVDDAAQTLRPHSGCSFTSYSFQAGKILPLGEGGMLVTDDEGLAQRAREFSSLGYRMSADGPAIYKRPLKDPSHARHHALGYNYRMSEHVARAGLACMDPAGVVLDGMVEERRECASFYHQATQGTDWITPQHVHLPWGPDGWTHDYWSYAVALESADLWHPFVGAVERHGGERPYAAWRLTYQEPAFRHLAPDGTCPVAEDLQPRLVQFQTNGVEQAERNAEAVAGAIRDIGG